jgi:hypothetical protein
MPYASYQICRLTGPVWRWQACHHGELSNVGYVLSKAAARRAARTWLRNKRSLAQRAEADNAPSGLVPAEQN